MKALIILCCFFLSSFAFAVNRKPVAVMTASPEAGSGYLPMMVHFSAAGSHDPDGSIVSYTWDLGDGTTATGPEVDHYYTTSRIELVRLTVVDNGGKDDKANRIYRFKQDRTDPTLDFDISDGSIVRIKTPIITAFYSDVTSKVDPTRVRFFLDQVDVTSHATISDSHAVLQFTSAWPLSPGNHALIVSVMDYYDNRTIERVTFSYQPDEITTNFLNGIILDGNNVPVANAQILSIDGPVNSQLSGTTDSNGKFSIPFSVGGEYKIRVAKFGYLDVQKSKTLIQGQDDFLEKVYLAEADTKTTLISASSGGTATNTSGSISLYVPPGSLSSDVTFSFTETKTGKTLRVPLPNGSQFTFAQSTQASGAIFSEPGILSIANVLGFPAGFEIPYGVTGEGLGVWVDSGSKAKVTEDGTRINVAISNFSKMADSIAEGDQNTNTKGPDEPKQTPPEGPQPTPDPNPNPCATQGSRISNSTCNLSIDYSLPSVKRRGKDVALSLSYSSLSANPQNIIQVRSPGIRNAATPVNLRQTISWAGQSFETTYSGEAGVKDSALAQAYKPVNAQGQMLKTGSALYRAELASRFDDRYYAETPYFGGPAGEASNVQVREPVYLQEYGYGRASINNQRNSIFGSGWELNGWERIYPDADGALTLTDGDGMTRNFIPLSQKIGSTVIQKRVGAGVSNLIYHNGHILGADCEGNQVFRLDGKGRMTTLFGGANKLKADLSCPMSVWPARRGGLYIADSGNGRILYADKAGRVKVLASPEKNNISKPTFVSEDNVLAVHFVDGNEIKTISPFNGEVITMVGTSSDAYFKYKLSKPTQIHYDEYHNLVVLDEGSGKIIKFYINAGVSRVIFDGVKGVKAMAFDPILKRFFLLDKKGLIHHWTGWGAKKTHLVDVSGNSPKLYLPSIAKKKALPVVTAIAYSPELGLVTATESGVKMASLDLEGKSTQEVHYVPSVGDFSQITQNTNGTFTRILPDKTILTYNQLGFIIEKRISDGSIYTYEYLNDETLTKIVVPGGGFYSFEYDGRGFVKAIIDPANRATNLIINESGDLIALEDPSLQRREFSYDANHLLISKLDERRLQTSYDYVLSRIKSAVYPGDRVRNVEYALANHITQQTEGQEVPRLAINGVTTNFVSPEGREKTAILDEFGVQNGEVDGEGGRSYILRNEDSLPIQSSTPEGRKNIREYDELGRITRTVDANGSNEMSYDPTTQKISSMKDAFNNTVSYQYNNQGLVERIIDKKGKETGITYFTDGTIKSIIDPVGNESSIERDANGNETASIDPMGNKTQFGRDDAGNIISQTDPLGHVTSFEFDANNRMSKMTDAKGGQTLFDYLPSGELESLTDANGNKTTLVYNEQNKVTRLVNPLGQEENMSFDLDGNMTSKVNKKGQSFSYSYNGNNLLINKTFPGDSVIYNFDKDKLLVGVTDNDSEIRMEHDVFKRPIVEMSSHYSGQVEYLYNARGEKINTRLFLNGADVIDIKRSLDQNGDLYKTSAYFFGKKVEFERWLDDAGRLIGLKLPNGAITNYQLDKNSRITEALTWLTPGGMSHFLGYRYSATGNVSWSFEQFNLDSKTNRFEYDEINRLAKEDTISQRSYNLDPVGNDLAQGGQYNELNQLSENNSHLFEYDLNGNLTKKTSKTTGEHFDYTWSAENQLSSVKVYKAGNVLSKTISHQYDGLGRRIVRSVQDHLNPANSYIQKFIYDGEHILAILDGDNSFVAGYLYGPEVDDPIAMVVDLDKDGEVEVLSFIKDRQNSVKLITNEKAEPIQEINYSAYGETQITVRGQIKHKIPNIFYYTSRQLEPETGDYYYRARYYDPKTGRFLSLDPIGLRSGEINLYRYADNNPNKYRDPSGLIWNFVIGGVVAGIYEAVTGGDKVDVAIATVVGTVTSGASVLIQVGADLLTNPSDLARDDEMTPPKPTCNPSLQSCAPTPNPIPQPTPQPAPEPNQCGG